VPTNEAERLPTEGRGLLSLEEEDKNAPEAKLQLVIEPARECTCNRVLIVDDVSGNLYVLQSYMTSVGLTADEVPISASPSRLTTARKL
jgi:hypothetical protein